MDLENRAILAGFGLAIAGSLALVLLEYLVLPPGIVGAPIVAWFLFAGIVAPQLYLAWQGVPPATSRRGVAAIFLAFAVATGLEPFVDSRILVPIAIAIVAVELVYEGFLGYRDAFAEPDATRTREE